MSEAPLPAFPLSRRRLLAVACASAALGGVLLLSLIHI